MFITGLELRRLRGIRSPHVASNGADRTYVCEAALGWAVGPQGAQDYVCDLETSGQTRGGSWVVEGQCVCGQSRRLRTGSDSYTVLQMTMITGKKQAEYLGKMKSRRPARKHPDQVGEQHGDSDADGTGV